MLAVTVLFVLVLLLVTLLIQKSQLEKAKVELRAKIERSQTIKDDAEKELERRTALEYIEQKARELGMVHKDETLYQTVK